jgi:catechol 2,3-dioxygenase-like lactoylglutathione lyase family enzyme
MTHPPIDSQITFLYTHDLAQTAHFYEDIMGLPLKLDQGSCHAF